MNSPGFVRICGVAAVILFGLITSREMSAADYPKATISNGSLTAKLYLPNAERGFYRGTRFDWSGVISSLKYGKHDYFGPWFDRVDPPVHDFIYSGQEIVTGSCSSITGPVEEFNTNDAALGYAEAQPGGTFIKIGIGVLRKPDNEPYDRYRLYDIVNPGKWTVHVEKDSVEFVQTLNDAASGYGYVYRKTVRLATAGPKMVLEHSLRNTGSHPIETDVYNHNFLVLDKLPPGPDFVITFPFVIQPLHPAKIVELNQNQIIFPKVLEGQESATAAIGGFGNKASDYDIRIDNKKAGAGMHITGDHPLHRLSLWSIRSVLAVEPFIEMKIGAGEEFQWNLTYTFYTPMN